MKHEYIADDLVQTDALTPDNEGTPTWFTVEADNVEYLVKTVIGFIPFYALLTEEHVYQDWREGDVFLYPGPAPTVCSCGATPNNKPSSDWDWWVAHITRIIQEGEK